MARLPLGLLLAAAALTLPAATATPPRDPFEATLRLDADPVVGSPVTLRVRVEDHATNMPHGDTIRLELPDWVTAAEPLEWSPAFREGGTYERTWTLTPSRVGFWAARLAFTEPGDFGIGVIGPTLRAWSDVGDGAWTTDPVAQVAPDGAVDVSAETSIEGDRHVLVMEARGTRAWMRHAEVYVQGNAMGVGDTGIGKDGETAVMRLVFFVPNGTGAALAPNAGVRVRFDGGSFEATEEQGLLACLSFTASRDASGPKWEEHGACRYSSRFDLSAPSLALALALPLALALRRRPPQGAARAS